MQQLGMGGGEQRRVRVTKSDGRHFNTTRAQLCQQLLWLHQEIKCLRQPLWGLLGAQWSLQPHPNSSASEHTDPETFLSINSCFKMRNILTLQCLLPTLVDECHQNPLKRSQARVGWNTGGWGAVLHLTTRTTTRAC